MIRIGIAEFIRRFLLHFLPDGFHRIRYYGLFSNGHRAEKLALCRRLLNVPRAPEESQRDEEKEPDAPEYQPFRCPCCGGRMNITGTFAGSLSRPYHVRPTRCFVALKFACPSFTKC